MYWVRRATISVVILLLISFAAWAVPRALDPTDRSAEKRARDKLWVNSSPYFWDRQACRWMGLCGLHHLRKDPASRGDHDDDDDTIGGELRRRSPVWEEDVPKRNVNAKRNVQDRRRILKDVPQYVMQYAPLVHLYSDEEFWPSDIKDHVDHMTVWIDGEPLNSTETWTLNNLHLLNKFEDSTVILVSNDDVEQRPDWLHSHRNIPNDFELENPEDGGQKAAEGHDESSPLDKESTTWYDVDKNHPIHRIADPRRYGRAGIEANRRRRLAPRGHKPDADGYSNAPAVLVLVDKGSGIMDAFWFFFYSYNLGQTVLGVRFGNHVGDWEHCMVRFQDGVPKGIYFSEHEGGQAYAWNAVQKSSTGRPVIYSAVGSHAMYPLPAKHPYVLPFNLLKDITDEGPLWDPSLNNYAYHYDYTIEHDVDLEDDDDDKEDRQPHSLVPASKNPNAPTSWFHFRGRWGDEVYSLADPRQWRLFGQYHYVTGPIGPKFKSLYRSKLCQAKKCKIAYELDPSRTWY